MRIKVCGLRTVADAVGCAEAGADWIGLNFHPKSPRYVDETTARAIVEALPAGCEAVGLFVDQPSGEVARLAARVGLEIVQLHGSEPLDDLIALGHLKLLRAFRLGNLQAVEAMKSYLVAARERGREPDAVLVDAFVAGIEGGTGHAIGDELLRALPPLPRLVLAGGLTPENVAVRARMVRPWMVDVASGVESSPGLKDMAKVKAFVASARGAF